MNKLRLMWARFWDELGERDRRMLMICAVFVGLYLSYKMYSSTAGLVQQNRRVLSEKKAVLLWMEAAEKQRATQQKGPEVLDGSKGLTVFSEALKKTSFHTFPYQLQQLGEGELQLSFESVPYNAFLAWLSSMDARYAMRIQSFNAEKKEKTGLVHLTLIIVLDQ
jgi:general secretion pathway protein M